MNDKIGQYVRETMKSYGVSDRKLERGLISACRDEYEMQLAGGAYEDEAFRVAVENIEEIAKSRIPRRNKFAFALGMGILALCISVLEMLASLLVARLDARLHCGDRRHPHSVCHPQARQLPLVRFPDLRRHAGIMDRFDHPASARFSLQLYAGERS